MELLAKSLVTMGLLWLLAMPFSFWSIGKPKWAKIGTLMFYGPVLVALVFGVGTVLIAVWSI